jgi:outer membrane protein assembly factor BamB
MWDGRAHRLARGTRAARRVAVALLASVALTGCWFQEGGTGGNARFNAAEGALTVENVASLQVGWRANVDAALSEPIIAGDRVYVTARDYVVSGGSELETLSVQAFDRVTGALVWESSLLPHGDPVEGDVLPVGLIDGALWVPYWHGGMPECTGRVDRLDPATGNVVSSDALSTRPTSSVVSGASIVAISGYNCAGSSSELAVLDPATRNRRWSHTFPVGHSATTPTIVGDMVVIKTSGPRVASQTLYGFRARGCSASACGFSWDLRDTPFQIGRPVAGPGGIVFDVVNTSDGVHVRAVDSLTGEVRWTSGAAYSGTVPGGLSGMAVADGVLYVAGADRSDGGPETAHLDAYDLEACSGSSTCDPMWTTGFPDETAASTAPAVAGGVAYVGLRPGGAHEPAVVAVDAAGCGQATCPPLTRVDLTTSSGAPLLASVPTQLAVGGGRVFAVWLPGHPGAPLSQLAALAPTTGV